MPVNRNIRLMYGIALLQGMCFYAPIASLYRQAAGLNLAQIALIEGISYLFALAMELPWGMLADRIGYRRTMIASCCIYALSKLVFWQANGFGAFLLERFVLSAALAGLSGVEESILHLSCPDGQNQRVFGVHGACCTAGQLIATGAYTLLIGAHYRAAALATLIAYALAAVMSLGIVEVQRPLGKSAFHRGLLPQLKGLLADKRFMLALAGFALFRESVQMVTVWLSQNQFLRCGMSSAGMGAACMAVTIIALGGAFSKRLTDILGQRRFSILCLLAAGAGCAALAITRSAMISIACVCLAALCRALMEPLFSSICNNRVPDANRATMLSLFALVQSFVAAGANASFGRIADASLNAALWACAGICLIGCAAIAILPRRPEMKCKYHHLKA